MMLKLSDDVIVVLLVGGFAIVAGFLIWSSAIPLLVDYLYSFNVREMTLDDLKPSLRFKILAPTFVLLVFGGYHAVVNYVRSLKKNVQVEKP